MMTTLCVFLLSLFALSTAQQQQQQSSTGCSFQSSRAPYTLNWVVDPSSQNVFFNLTYRNFPQGSFTGVGFGDSMAAGIDVILVTLPAGTSTPQVIDASVKGYAPPTRDANSEVQTRTVSWIGGNLYAQFIRPLASANGVDTSLSGCVTWNFISSPGPAFANGTYSKHTSPPEQQQQCNIATRCQGTIPAQFINTPNNGAWSSGNNNNNMMNNNNMNSQQYSPYPTFNQNNQQWSNQQQQMNQQQQFGQPNGQMNNQQYNQQYQQPFQTQQWNQQPQYQNQQFTPNQQFNQNQQNQQQLPIGGGVQQQPPPFYNPYSNQNSANNSQQQQYGRKKRQAGTNIYGYNTDSNAASNPLIVQNPNYQFLPNYLADEYARTYSQASAQYDARNNGGVNGAQRNPSFNQATQKPVLTNQQQNQQNYQNIQRDTASGAYSTIAPATNIYGYNYNTPSTSGLLSTQLTPSSSSTAAGLNPQFDSPSSRATNSVSQRDQSLQRFYNPGVTSVGNVYTGSLYNGGNGPNLNGQQQPSSNQAFFNPSSTSGTSSSTNGVFFDPTTGRQTTNNNNGVFYASANRGPQPGQIVYYDTATVGRKKRSVDSIRDRRQVRFYDPGNNQSAMYYPYRTETDFNLNAGQQGFSQVGGSPQYSAPLNGQNGVNTGFNTGVSGSNPGTQRYYDTSRGVYVDNVPQYDSRGGNQYLKTAPVNPQSPNFVQTLQNNARALNDYVDPSCSKQDPYWCQSYVAQIMQAQNSFGSYTQGTCNTLVASLQYSDNRCCNAVRAVGCQT